MTTRTQDEWWEVWRSNPPIDRHYLRYVPAGEGVVIIHELSGMQLIDVAFPSEETAREFVARIGLECEWAATPYMEKWLSNRRARIVRALEEMGVEHERT